MTGRDLLRSGLVALALLSTVSAYDRVFEATDWRLPALASGLVALLIATAVRSLAGGAIVAGIVSAVGFVALVPVFAGVIARPAIPDAALASQLAEIFSQGLAELEVTPAPAPLLPGLALLLVAGFWAVTHLAHELLVRWSRAGATLTSIAVLWAVPLIVPVRDSAWELRAVPFIAAGALLLLFTAEHRIPRPTTAAVGIGMAALAIATAVTVPGILPGFQSDAWYGLGAGSSGPRGYQPIVDVSTRLQQGDEREVLRVRSSQPTYLRLAGLDTFDGFTWRLGPDTDGSYRPDPSTLYPTEDPLPPETPASVTEPVFVDIEVRDLANIYVPVPYQPTQVLGPFRDEMVWSTDGGFLATWDTEDGQLVDDGPNVGVREGVTYRVQADRPVPTREQLQDVTVDEATLQRFTQLPRPYPQLTDLAEQIYETADATTTVDRALALQDWFTGPDGAFTYDLDVPALRGDDALERFILEDRIGYCEYFAAGMATMLRATGIPARVATGFLPGEVITEAEPGDGRELTEYAVATSDAHAWVEVLFPGFGWITFEPTPRSDGSQIQPRADALTPLENERERQARQRQENADESGDSPQLDVPDLEAESLPDDMEADAGTDAGRVGSDTDEGASVVPMAIVVVAVVVAILLVAILVGRRRVRARGITDARERVLAAQAKLHAAAVGYGVARRPAETSVELARRWEHERRTSRHAGRFAAIAQAAAFGGHVDDSLAHEAEALSAAIIAELRLSVSPGMRRTARLRGPWVAAKAAKQRGRERIGAGR